MCLLVLPDLDLNGRSVIDVESHPYDRAPRLKTVWSFVESAGEVVTKRELFVRVWPEMVVEESSHRDLRRTRRESCRRILVLDGLRCVGRGTVASSLSERPDLLLLARPPARKKSGHREVMIMHPEMAWH
jgi:hypothetical protein